MTTRLSSTKPKPPENIIEVSIKDIEQFFNTIDPSPFHEKDLDEDLEQFIVSWATEHPIENPVRLIVHLQTRPAIDSQAVIERAVHHYFAHQAGMKARELSWLLWRGRLSLVIGLSFMALCISGAEVIVAMGVAGANIVRESLHIAAWVAMWHPMETFLYGWWPLRRERNVFRKLSVIPVDVRHPNSA